ncbi:MAG: T9SS type A sorting domain-containing protein, partial [Flavobacteriales bacterium]
TISVTGNGDGATGMDPILEAFSGTCGNLVSLGCVDATLRGATETLTLPTTPGTTYYYRVYYWPYGGPPTDYSFTTCVYTLAPPPNDDCAGAIAITPGSFCAPQLFSGGGATESLPAATCGGFTGNANDDIWFSFVATQADMTVGAIGSPGAGTPSTVYDAVVQAFSGTCASLTPIACADATLSAEPETLELTGLTVGTTYYFRVYHYYAPPANPPTVGVCVVNGTGISIGMDELSGGQAWGLFPNPATGIVNLRYNGEAGMGSIELYDATGRGVLVERGALAQNSSRALDVHGLSAGVYTVRLTVNGQRSEQRLVIE